jgi:two-component system NarL family response regulator
LKKQNEIQVLLVDNQAKSHLRKDSPEDELGGTIRAAHAGRQIPPRKAADRLAARHERAKLSQHEVEALQLLTTGCSNKEIGAALFINEDTIKARLKKAVQKTQGQKPRQCRHRRH